MQQKMPADQITVAGSTNLLYFLALSHATCFTPFLRSNFGTEALGFQGLGAVVILLLLAVSHPLGGLFLLAWFVTLMLRRAQTFVNWRDGAVGHSQYAGDSTVARRFFCKNERTAKLLIEPLLCGGAGYLLSDLSPVVGTFVMAGGGSLFLVQVFERFALFIRVQRLRDAEIEQRVIAAAYRGEDIG